MARRDYDKAKRVPSELRAEMTRAASTARLAWIDARKNSNFKTFLPHLQKERDLKFKYAECFESADNIYDILLDDYSRV